MPIVLEASLLLAAYLSIALAAYWFLLGRYKTWRALERRTGKRRDLPARATDTSSAFLVLPRPRENDGPRLTPPHDDWMVVNGRRGSSTPLLCKACRRHPWNKGPELLCDSCSDRYWDALDEFSRGQMDGVW